MSTTFNLSSDLCNYRHQRHGETFQGVPTSLHRLVRMWPDWFLQLLTNGIDGKEAVS